MKRRFSDEERQRYVAEYQASGETVWAFAKRSGLNAKTICRWVAPVSSKRPKTKRKLKFAQLWPSSGASKPEAVGKLRVVIVGGLIEVEEGFNPALLRAVVCGIERQGRIVIGHGIPIYVALSPVDMRWGFERLGGLVREQMQSEPKSRALFAFVGKRGHTMKILTWDGTGAILIHKKLDCGRFELPRPTRVGETYVVISDALFDVIYKGIATQPPRRRRKV